MSELRYTLVSDGSSDRMLLPLLDWLMEEHSARPFAGRWADLAQIRNPPTSLVDRVRTAVDLYPCDLLFVHRDAERQSHSRRSAEIARQVEASGLGAWVPVVPVRMQEAWFLFDEGALREASSNPNGGVSLSMPPLAGMEDLPNPKRLLEDLLRRASGRRGRRLKALRVGPMKHRLSTLIDDFAPLRALAAFAALEADVRRVVAENRWGPRSRR